MGNRDTVDQKKSEFMSLAPSGTNLAIQVVEEPLGVSPEIGENCVLYLPLNENEEIVAEDRSNENNSGILRNFDWNENSGWTGSALRFDGVDDYVEIPDDNSLHINYEITIEAWIKVPRENHDQAIVSKGYDYLLNIWGPNRSRPGVVEIGGIDPEGEEYWLPGNTPVDDNEWHHIAFTYDGSVMKIWIGGKLDAEKYRVFSFRTTDHPVCIGSLNGAQRFLNGLVDEVRIYNQALTEEGLFPKSWIDRIFESPNLVLLALVVFSVLFAVTYRRGYWGAMPKIKLPKPKSIEEIIPFILIVICGVAARFIGSEVLVLAVFIITLGIYAWRKYGSRMLVGTAIFLLVVCAVLLARGSENLANDVAIWAYYFLVIGVLGFFIEYLREKA